MTDVWDDIPAPLTDFPDKFSFAAIGDSIVGTITNVRKFTASDGKISPELWIETTDGERSIICGALNLMSQLLELRPMVGDRIAIVFTSEKAAKVGKSRFFDVSLKRADGSTVDPAPAPATSAADLL